MAKKTSNVSPELISASRAGNVKKIKDLIARGADVNFSPPAGTPLENAVRAGRLDAATELIKAGANIHHRSFFGSLVELAVTQDQPKMLSLLLKAGAKPGGDGSGATPLLQAASYNKLELAKILLQAGADVNETGSVVCGGFGEAEISEEALGSLLLRTTHVPNPPTANNATPLIVAVRRGHVEMVHLLLDAGADANRTDKEGFSALYWATQSGNAAIAGLLQAGGATALEFSEGSAAAALLAAARAGDVARLKELLAKRIDPDLKHGTDDDAERTALMCAAENGHEDAARFLIKSGADVNLACGSGLQETHNKTALMYAAEKGHAGMIRLLLKAKAKPNAKTMEVLGGGRWMAVHFAAEGGHVEALRALLDAGVSVAVKTGGGETSLSLACAGGHAATAKFLIERGAYVDHLDETKMTPLAHAATHGGIAVVKLLLDAGANPDPEGQSPLELASTTGHADVVKMLLKTGAKATRGKSAASLTRATLTGGLPVVETLLHGGTDPNETDDDGFTPLMGAVRAGNLEMMKLLLKAGADINARNNQKQTALDLAHDNIKMVKDQLRFIKQLSAGESDLETAALVDMLKKSGGTDELVKFLESEGGKRGKDLGPMKPASKPSPTEKKTPEPDRSRGPVLRSSTAEGGRESAPTLPDFSKRSATPEYRRAVEELQKVCGSKPHPITVDADEDSHFHGCMSFRVTAEAGRKILADHQKAMLDRGFYLLRHDRGYSSGEDRLALLPTADRREVLLAFQTNGANCDVMPEDIVRWLDDLEKEEPFQLTGAAFDWCEGRFNRPLRNSRTLAKKMFDFCPDIVDQGTGSVAALAKTLNKSGEFFLWWD